MKHLKFILILIFFAILPSFLIKSGTDIYFNHVEEGKFKEIFSAQEKYLRRLRNDVILKTSKNRLTFEINNKLLFSKKIDALFLEKLQNYYEKKYPNLLKILYFDNKYKLVNKSGIKYRYIYSQFVKTINNLYLNGEYKVSGIKNKLFKKIIGDWQRVEKVAFRKADFSDIVSNYRRSDLYWNNISDLSNENEIKGTILIIIDKRIYDKYFSFQKLLNNIIKNPPLPNLIFGKFSNRKKSVIEFYKKNKINKNFKNHISNLMTTENGDYLFTFLPINDIEENIVYAKSLKNLCYPEKKHYIKIINIFLIIFLIIFISLSFLIFYGFINIFISARIKLISIFMLASILPLSVMYYFSFLYIQYKHDSILKEKYNLIREKIGAVNEAESNYKNSLLHFSVNVKNMEITKKFKLDELNKILTIKHSNKEISDYYIFNKSGEIILKYGNSEKDNFSKKLARSLARSVMDFYNGKKYKKPENVKASDSIQSVLTKLIFDPKTGTLNAIFKSWGRIHTMDFLGEVYNFYIDVITDDKENATGVIVLYFHLKDKLEKILKTSIKINNSSSHIKLFASPLENISVNNQIPEKFNADITNFAHKIIMENSPQKGFVNYKGKKYLIFGMKLTDIKNRLVMGILPYSDISKVDRQNNNLIIRLFIITILIIIFISIVITRKFLSPIKYLQDGVEELSKKNLDYKIHIDSNDEFGNLSKTFNHMTTTLKDTMFQLELSNENLKLTNITLDKRLSELQVLYDISHKLHFISEIDDLIELILSKINETLKSHHSSVLLLSEDKSTLELKMIKGVEIPKGVYIQLKPDEGIAGIALKENRVILVNDVNNDDRFKPLDTKEIKSLLCAPLVISNVPIGVINVVDKTTEDRMFSQEDKNLLNSIASQLSITIENFYLQKELVEKERMARELEIAKDIQAGLLPSEIPKIPNFSVDFNNTPAKECGGDYYDYITLNDELTAFTIADVSGKGVPAALIMVMAKSILMVEAPKEYDTKTLVKFMNDQLSASELQGRFITFFYGILEHKSGIFRFTNGGHNYPYMYRAKSNEIEELELDGMILGVMNGVEYENREVKFETDDILVLYTDGVTEAQNVEKKLFGEELLKEIIIENHKKSAEEIRKEIERRVFEHTGNAPQFDDITLIVIKKES